MGAFAIAQSGQPWEKHSYLPYASLTTNTSETDRYAEPAGSHRADGHAQLDVNYTQELPFLKRYRGVIDVRTCSTSSTARPATTSSRTSTPPTSACRRRFYDPRRLEMTFRLDLLKQFQLASFGFSAVG